MLCHTLGIDQRIAVFTRDGSQFIGWVSLNRIAGGQAGIGFDGFTDWSFVRESLLTEEQKRLTTAKRAG